VQVLRFSVIAALAVGLGLSGCATTATRGTAAASGSSGTASANAPASVALRDLTPAEKKVIMAAVGDSLRDPKAAKYRWAKFPVVVTDESVNYCSIVNALSPYPAYNGEQAYIVEARMSGNRVTSAVLGLIAGGKDRAIVDTMCAKYGLDPNKSS
jgi:hypothetical protein